MSEAPHEHEVGDVLDKVDTSEWEITNRMVDVDTDETLYRLRETEVGPFQETEILTESEIARSFELGAREPSELPRDHKPRARDRLFSLAIVIGVAGPLSYAFNNVYLGVIVGVGVLTVVNLGWWWYKGYRPTEVYKLFHELSQKIGGENRAE